MAAGEGNSSARGGVVRKMQRTPGHSLTHNVGECRVFWHGCSCCTAGAWSSFVPLLEGVSAICTTCNPLSQYFSSRTESPRANARPWAVSTPASGPCPLMPCQSITMAATYNASKHPINRTLGFIDLLPLRECETGHALPQFPRRNHVAIARVTKQPLASQHDRVSPCPPADALGGRRPLTIPYALTMPQHRRGETPRLRQIGRMTHG